MEQEIYRIYFKQHIGNPALSCVLAGEKVCAGQLIGRAGEGLSLNVHSSVTGEVIQVTEGFADIRKCSSKEGDYLPLTENSPLELIKEAGICGMGGAGFPAYAKLDTDLSQGGMVIINAAECEPILNHNLKRIAASPKEIVEGLLIVQKITGAAKGIIALKEKHSNEVKILKEHLKENMELALLPDIYPMGEERAIVREVTGKLLDANSLPLAAGAVVINLETLYRIYEAVILKKPAITKDLTVGGAVEKGITVLLDVPVGTQVESLLQEAGGLKPDVGELILGGPFTGKRTIKEEYISKTTGGIIAAMPFLQDKRNMGLLVCACGAGEERLRQIAASMGAKVVGVEFCKQAHEVKGNLKCDNPGKCPGQSAKVLKLRSQGAETLLISNCTDCSNTVMSIAPGLKMPVYHCTDGALRAAGLRLVRKVRLGGV
ncbi:MAG: electron transport protein [Anaerocolumna sp.]|jgi:proline reductase-associated electron transfer protein PrdC|nr:electron transport protein [Anaerocolumna sp.]